jgi:hypothetical protein
MKNFKYQKLSSHFQVKLGKQGWLHIFFTKYIFESFSQILKNHFLFKVVLYSNIDNTMKQTFRKFFNLMDSWILLHNLLCRSPDSQANILDALINKFPVYSSAFQREFGVEEYYLLECDTVQFDKSLLTIQRNILPLSSGLKSKPGKQPASRESHTWKTRFRYRLGTDCFLLDSGWLLAWITLWPRRWRQYIPLKHRWTSITLHGVMSQKTVLFIVTVIRT